MGRKRIRPCPIAANTMYINLHTHNQTNKKGEIAIYNLQLPKDELSLYQPCSVGLHPWYVNPENYKDVIKKIKEIAQYKKVVAIGECGLDKICTTPFELQKEVFKEQIAISEEAEKPVIIHCVKSYNEIIALKKEIKPLQSWIIHGFRGKAETAKMLSTAGIIVSIGEKFNPEIIQTISSENIFIESDESKCSIEEIYRNIADTWHITSHELQERVEKLYKKVFVQKAR